ncbi:MAG: hypothetical protein KAU21_13025 [Gammaproteobacteria bacterium]|nr:hypothetical protein [Gammaproteobacteria bacterium]
MENGVEKKYIILFAILIALTGFTFESQSGNITSAQAPSQNTQEVTAGRP